MHPFVQETETSAFEQFLQQHVERDLLRFTTAGSVDDGKSTLIGRLLYDSKTVYEDQLRAIETSRLNRSSGPVDFSLLTDGLRAEREQGITIDVAYRYFNTARRKFIIADTPGHEQYTRNMATGASTADAAIVLVDARKGLLPQSRRHAYIASLLGIRHIVAAINKMDLVDYSEEVFLNLQRDLQQLSQKIGHPGIESIPVSALEGDNIVLRSQNMPWYEGPALLEYLEEVPISATAISDAFRFPVQYVIRPNDSFRGFAGQIASGSIRPGDPVLVLPSGIATRVSSIDSYDGVLAEASTGSSVTLRLEDEIDLSRGDLLVNAQHRPHIARRFAANIVWMHAIPLELEKTWILRHTTRQVRAKATLIRSRVDVDTMEHHPAEQLRLNDIGSVELETTSPLFFDLYAENRASGSFILIDPLSNTTVGAGMITENLEAKPPAVLPYRLQTEIKLLQHPVTPAERYVRQGHYPAAVWLGTWNSLAHRVERSLFEAGYNVLLLEDTDLQNASSETQWSESLMRSLYSAGLIALYVTASISTRKKRQLHAAIGPGHILDADLLDLSGDDEAAVKQIAGWVEGLRIHAREGN